MDFQNESDLQVEKILDKKVFNGKTLYLVKWKNYPVEQATWECNKLLTNVKDKIREFKYSKRLTEQIPNIKFQEDFPETQVRDTFKRKRGRPPRMSFNSYRQAGNQSTLKKSDTDKNVEILIKRGRGRPRGSKNKRVRHAHFQEQSSVSSDSEYDGKSQNQDKTITNEDFSDEQSEELGNKKQRKLKKLMGKGRQKSRNLLNMDEKEESFDIVDSQDQTGRGQINLNSGENVGNSQCIAFDSHQHIDSNMEDKFKNQNTVEQGKKLKEIPKKKGKSLQDGEIVFNERQFVGKKQIIRRDLSKVKQQKNVQTMSSEKDFQKIDEKHPFQKQKDLIEQLEQFQGKYFKEKKYEHKNVNLNIQQGQFSQMYNQPIEQKQNESANEKLKKVKNAQTGKQKPKQTVQTTEVEKISEVEINHEINENFFTKFSEKGQITKIYHLQTIQLCLSKNQQQFIDNEFSQFSNDSFSQQKLKKISLAREIVDFLSDSANIRKQCLFKIDKQTKLLDKSKAIFQQLCTVVKDGLMKDNQQIIDLLTSRFQVIRPHCFGQINDFQGMVQEALYLIEFNQGKIIKKMTASEILLHLMIDMLKRIKIETSSSFYEPLLNFVFYIKFLERLFLPQRAKNEPITKLQKSTVRNIKLDDKTTNKKAQLQDLLIEALKNAKAEQNHLHRSNVSRQNKQKKLSNLRPQKNESKLQVELTQNSGELLSGPLKQTIAAKVEEELMK